MSKDIETTYQVIPQGDFKNELSVNEADVQRTIDHLKMVKRIVSEVMKVDVDYGATFEGAKDALLKPGAEKLLRLFGLGARFIQLDKEVDRFENYASYTYKCEVYQLKTGTVIATCEGTANSWEKKYKMRAVYVDKKYSHHEPTPISDIQNTLMKMAQKRGMVGATLIATGASDYFTQDEDEIAESGKQVKPIGKTDPSKFATKGESKNHSAYIVPIGKFKNQKLGDIKSKELNDYVTYIAANTPDIDGLLKEFLDTAREYIRASA